MPEESATRPPTAPTDEPTDEPDTPDTMTHDTRDSETDHSPTDTARHVPTLQEVSHTNPYTNRPFGTTQTFGRGKLVAADGGEADAAPDLDTLEDVDHTPAEDDVDGAQGTFDRGREGPSEPDDE